MTVKNLKATLDRLEDAIINSEYFQEYKTELSKNEFKKRKYQNSQRLMAIQVKFLEDSVWDLMKLGEDKKIRRDIVSVIEYLKQLKDCFNNNDSKSMLYLIQKIRKLLPEEKKDVSFKISVNLPSEIQEEVAADIKELNQCYDSRCYRSAVIICGRILETCLHRKYFEATERDLLEKSPGIGLGKLIAKMMEAKIPLDPGLTQQIHLVNQVRIFSVHKKQSVFYPSQSQTEAMILYTLDVIGKLFQ